MEHSKGMVHICITTSRHILLKEKKFAWAVFSYPILECGTNQHALRSNITLEGLAVKGTNTFLQKLGLVMTPSYGLSV